MKKLLVLYCIMIFSCSSQEDEGIISDQFQEERLLQSLLGNLSESKNEKRLELVALMIKARVSDGLFTNKGSTVFSLLDYGTKKLAGESISLKNFSCLSFKSYTSENVSEQLEESLFSFMAKGVWNLPKNWKATSGQDQIEVFNHLVDYRGFSDQQIFDLLPSLPLEDMILGLTEDEVMQV